MERLTENTPTGVIPSKNHRNDSMDVFLTRLAEYENLDVPLDRLRELVAADKNNHLYWLKPTRDNFTADTAVWYVDAEGIQRGKIQSVDWSRSGQKVDGFSVLFDDDSFDEFFGEAIDDSIFMSEYEANRAYEELTGR